MGFEFCLYITFFCILIQVYKFHKFLGNIKGSLQGEDNRSPLSLCIPSLSHRLYLSRETSYSRTFSRSLEIIFAGGTPTPSKISHRSYIAPSVSNETRNTERRESIEARSTVADLSIKPARYHPLLFTPIILIISGPQYDV